MRRYQAGQPFVEALPQTDDDRGKPFSFQVLYEDMQGVADESVELDKAREEVVLEVGEQGTTVRAVF